MALSLERRVILAVLQLSGMALLESITLSCSTIFIEAFSGSSLSISNVSPMGPGLCNCTQVLVGILQEIWDTKGLPVV